MFEMFAYKLHCPGFAVPIHKSTLILKSHRLLLEKSAITMPARKDMAKFLPCLLCLIIHLSYVPLITLVGVCKLNSANVKNPSYK